MPLAVSWLKTSRTDVFKRSRALRVSFIAHKPLLRRSLDSALARWGQIELTFPAGAGGQEHSPNGPSAELAPLRAFKPDADVAGRCCSLPTERPLSLPATFRDLANSNG